jgi:hypothetical protein
LSYAIAIALETIFETTVFPPIFITDSETQREARCVSEILEKIGGKRKLRGRKKFVSKAIATS